jgi:probable F420-dependent oxidoreductase
MEFGLVFANIGPFATPEGAAAIGKAAEEAGFDSVWTVEHVLVPEGYQSTYPYDSSGRMPAPDNLDLPDPLIWLTFVAAHTSQLKLGTGILIVPQRNPGILAKEVATLDKLSGGRVILGVGAGWLEEEFDALGVPFARRGARLDDYVGALRALWADDKASYEGEFVSLRDVYSMPNPEQKSVPIVIGGHSEAAARRAGRIGDGFFPGNVDMEKLEALFGVMRSTATEAGRDPDAIEITSGGAGVLGPDALEGVKRFADLGVSRIVIPPLAFDAEGIGPALAQYGENVIAKSR